MWGDHHHHGAGNEVSPGNRSCGLAASTSSFLVLWAELCLRGDLLEQPPSPAAGREACFRRHPVGKSAFVVLGVVDAVRYRVDGRESFCAVAGGVYGVVLLCAGTAYFFLTKALIAHQGTDSTLASSIGSDSKGRLSIVVYAAAIPLSFVRPWIACACYVTVAVMWLLPDPRIEKAMEQ